MENKEKFLPIGTVVLLENGKKEIMITSYCVMSKGEVYDKNGLVENIQDKVFDYGACLYPEGVLDSDQVFAFDHEQIREILFMGYETNEQKDLSKALLENNEEDEIEELEDTE